jgi:hypothetical protein
VCLCLCMCVSGLVRLCQCLVVSGCVCFTVRVHFSVHECVCVCAHCMCVNLYVNSFVYTSMLGLYIRVNGCVIFLCVHVYVFMYICIRLQMCVVCVWVCVCFPIFQVLEVLFKLTPREHNPLHRSLCIRAEHHGTFMFDQVRTHSCTLVPPNPSHDFRQLSFPAPFNFSYHHLCFRVFLCVCARVFVCFCLRLCM